MKMEVIFSDDGVELGFVRTIPDGLGNHRLVVVRDGEVVHDEIVARIVNLADRAGELIHKYFSPLISEQREGNGSASGSDEEEEATEAGEEETVDFNALRAELGTWAAVAKHLNISEYALRKLRAEQEG